MKGNTMERTIRKTFDRERVQFATKGESMTHQSHQQECDINHIMAKWQKTGVMEHVNRYQGDYADFTNMPQDYQDSMNQVLEAQDMFQSLPSSVRRRFGNDAGAFVDFVADPDNREELSRMGLLKQASTAPEELVESVKPSKGGKAPETPKASPEPKQEAKTDD